MILSNLLKKSKLWGEIKLMSRRIKSSGGKAKTLPIKDKKLLDRVYEFLIYEIRHARSKIKREQAYRNYMLFLIGFNTAFRAEDLLQLKVKDVIKGYMSIKELKTGKWQHFRMNKELHEEILEYIKKMKLENEDYLFMGQKTVDTYRGVSKKVIYPITRQNCQNTIFPKVIRACGIDFEFGLHSLRKTFGYFYVLNGGNVITLQKMYNHDEPSVTLLYVMWNKEDAEKDRESIFLGRRKK